MTGEPLEPSASDAAHSPGGVSATKRGSTRTPSPPRIPGYEVGAVIGRGAMGIVYRARQLIVDREVALKVLHPALSGQERLVRRLQREARTTARLAHPHVVTAIDMGETDGMWWYAMEFVDGPSLGMRLRQQGRLKEREALRLFIPLVEALEHLWEHGVVHRDIKPANILIDKAGGARLADLGLAFVEQDPQMTGQGGTLGTPHYISPEQAVDSSAADVRSDIWSLGATLYHAVCGRPPFSGESAAEILSAVLYHRVPDPREVEPSVSKGLALVLRKCMTHDPDGRYQTPRDLLLDLERVRERRAPKVRRRGLDPVERRGRTRRLAIASGAVVLAACATWIFAGEPFGKKASVDVVPVAERTIPPYPALETLLVHAEEDPGNLAQHRSELAALRATLPAEYGERWEEIDRELTNRLRFAVTRERSTATTAIEAALESNDYIAARAAYYDDFARAIYQRTGYRVDELEGQGVSIAKWAERQESRLTEQLRGATRELTSALEAWNGRVRAEVGRLVQRQEWSAALKKLELDGPEILAAAGFVDVRLPERELNDALEYGAQFALRSERERVKIEWRSLDARLTRQVKTRADTLLDELERARPRIRASAALLSWFELELESTNLQREKMPVDVADVAVTCLDALSRHAAGLDARAEELLEEDARFDLSETSRLCAPLWRKRRYDEVAGMWEETRAMVASLAHSTEAGWREDLERLAERRVREARVAFDLLRSASDRIRDLNGRTLPELRVGDIWFTNRRVESGPDPLVEGGFFLDGRERRIDFATLAADQLVVLAGYDDVTALSGEQRLGLASLLYHESKFVDARTVLHPELATDGLLAELELDLEGRVFTALEERRELGEQRAEEAIEFLNLVFDESRQGRGPSNVVKHIDILLEEYGDVAEVADQREELRKLRAKLQPGPERPVEAILAEDFGPTRLEFPRRLRVRLEYDFTSQSVGAWQHGDWVFDNLGWIKGKETRDWEGMRLQRGPYLVLASPLDLADFDLTLTFDEYPGPPKLLVVTVAGFHVALTGPGLPGSDQRSRLLVGSEDFDDILKRVREGAGTETEPLLASNATHTLRVQGYRGSGRCTVELDGRLLYQAKTRAPRDSNPVIAVRSWEPVRLRSVAFECDRSTR